MEKIKKEIVLCVAVFLSVLGFTEQYEALIIGTNLGGLGTLIASMASLISFKYIAAQEEKVSGNVMMLIAIICITG